MAVKLSIVTPTYNRKDLLEQCMMSLVKQTCYDFEWIVIDDGSNDGTREFMEQYDFTIFPFKVFYQWKENGGKHTALNASHSFIHGQYVLILDNDDMLTDDAVETVLREWNLYNDDTSIGIVTFLKQLTDGTLCCYAEKERKKLDVLNHRRIINVASDCCEVIRSELFLKFPFPIFDDERFLAETALWYRVGQKHFCLYVNRPIYICEYLDGGLTKGGKKLRIINSHGGMYTSYLRLNKRCSMRERIKAGLLFVCYGRFAGLSVGEIYKQAELYKGFVIWCMIPGMLMHRYWDYKYMRN